MYFDVVPNRNSPPAVLLRESYRDDFGRAKKRTLANLSKCSPEVSAGLSSFEFISPSSPYRRASIAKD